MAGTHLGTCFCGTVEIKATGTPVEMGYCHCGSCRSYSGAPLTSFILWKDQDVEVTRGAEHIGRFNKSEMSHRRFCTKCGGHLFTEHPGLGFTDVHAPVLRTVAFKPDVHLNYAETVLPMKDGVPKLRDFPASVGGSGEMMAD